MEDLKEKLVVAFSSSETTTEAQALQLLSRFTKPEYFRNSDEQLFRCACRNGWTVVLRALMELYDPDCQSLLDPLLLQASVNGHLDIVRYLVTEQHRDPMCENWYGKTPLQVACTNGPQTFSGIHVVEEIWLRILSSQTPLGTRLGG